MIRFRDIIKDTHLHSKIALIVDEAQNNWLRNLGKNDFIHSKSVESILDRIVPDELKTNQNIFDHGEIYLILTAVYLHDIGRKSSEFHHEIKSYDEIRNNPSKYYLPNDFAAEAVAQICAAHATESLWSLEKCDKNYGIAGLTSSGRTFNLQRLGALLRISDEIDNSYIRVQGISGQEESTRQLIRDINPLPQKGIIEIQAEPHTWKEWDELLRLRDYCQKRIREASNYLQDIGLDYYQVWLKPESFYAPLPPQTTHHYYDLVEVVASLVESRYSSVDVLVNIEGSEISVLCKNKLLGIVSRTAILVRRHLTAADAYEFRGILTHLKRNNYIDHGLIVAQEYPEEEVYSIVSSHGINIHSIDGLVSELYEFNSTIDLYIREYEDKDIFIKELFIPLAGRFESGKPISDLENYIINWIDSLDGVQLTVLGDYGAGKTTLVERLVYLASKRFKENPSNLRIPILLKLKDFGAFASIESVITDLFVNRLGIDITYKAFEALNKSGRFLLILDGFDEIPNTTTEPLVLQAFREIDKLIEQNSKLIVTCRTHFFKNNTEVRKAHEGTTLYHNIDDKYGYNIIFVNSFTHEQISAYLNKWAGDNASEYLDIVDNVYNLSDLATRPALLNIIAKTVPQMHNWNMSTVNASSLYELYTRFWLERDDWRSQIGIEERKYYSEALSNYMFEEGVSSIHYTRLPQLAVKWIGTQKTYPAELLDHELRTCNFLRRDNVGNYSFVHKSFQEFILAKIIFSQVISKDIDVNTTWSLPLENLFYKVSSKLMVTKETEHFFIQLFDIWLRETPGNLLIDICSNRYRAQVLIFGACTVLNWDDYIGVYATMLVDSKCKINKSDLIEAIVKSDNWIIQFRTIKSHIDNKPDLQALKRTLLLMLKQASSEQKSYVTEFLQIIEDREFDTEIETGDESELIENYPFSKERAEKELSREIQDISDSNELQEIKRKWQREWIKNKTEYDSKVKLDKKRKKKEEEEHFEQQLKDRKRQGKKS